MLTLTYYWLLANAMPFLFTSESYFPLQSQFWDVSLHQSLQ